MKNCSQCGQPVPDAGGEGAEFEITAKGGDGLTDDAAEDAALQEVIELMSKMSAKGLKKPEDEQGGL